MKVIRLALVLAALAASACASVNVKAEKLTRQAIQASEDNQCAKHPAPCLSDAQFKATNAQLYKVSLAGETYTKLARAGSAKPVDALAFAKAVTDALASVAILDPTGTVSRKLADLNGVLNAAGAK